MSELSYFETEAFDELSPDAAVARCDNWLHNNPNAPPKDQTMVTRFEEVEYEKTSHGSAERGKSSQGRENQGEGRGNEGDVTRIFAGGNAVFGGSHGFRTALPP
jgi:hypothetical protein